MAAQRRTNNSSVSNYELMETIRKYQVIYDKSCDDQIQKKDAWAAVACELNIGVDEAQNRYGNIRTVFSRHLKTIRRRRPGAGATGRLGGDVKIKEGFEYLRWLIGYIKPRNTGSHGGGKACGDDEHAYSSADDECEDAEGVDGDMWTDLLKEAFAESGLAAGRSEGNSDRPSGLDPTPSTSSANPKLPTASKHGFRTHRPYKKFPWSKGQGKRPWSAVEKLLSGARKPSAASAHTNDEDMMFCLSLAPKMKRLPERFKTAAQLRILQVICDYEMADSVPTHVPAQPGTC